MAKLFNLYNVISSHLKIIAIKMATVYPQYVRRVEIKEYFHIFRTSDV